MIQFEDSTLQKKLRDLSNSAEFMPRAAYDFYAQQSLNFRQTDWEIVFDQDWQRLDGKSKFSKWCNQCFRGGDAHQDMMQRFDNALHDWMATLNLDDTATN